MFWWVDFETRSSGTVEAGCEDEAILVAETIARPRLVRRIPYPAMPKLAVKSDVPAFCMSPHECAGRSACPRRRACDD